MVNLSFSGSRTDQKMKIGNMARTKSVKALYAGIKNSETTPTQTKIGGQGRRTTMKHHHSELRHQPHATPRNVRIPNTLGRNTDPYNRDNAQHIDDYRDER